MSEQTIHSPLTNTRNSPPRSGTVYPAGHPCRSPSIPVPTPALLTDPDIQELDRRLARHINPERSRRFRPADWERSLELLAEITRDERLAPEGLRISVVGSNGKGSCAFFLAALFEESLSGMVENPIGLFTSPHLLTVNERIRLNLSPCTGRFLLEYLQRLREILGSTANGLSYFEILTLLSLMIFRHVRSPVQIYEAGLGGRLDATRAAKASVVIVTPIALEHTEILGDDLEKILREKVGIVTGVTRLVLVMPQPLLSTEIIARIIRDRNPEVEICFYESDSEKGEIPYPDFNWNFARFSLEKMAAHPVSRELLIARLPPPVDLYATQNRFRPSLPGRMEKRVVESGTTGGRIVLIFDTAHNEPALSTALDAIQALPDFPGFEKCAILVGMLPDRQLAGALEQAARRGPGVLRQLVAEQLHPPVPGFCTARADRLGPVIAELLLETRGAEGGLEIVLVTGSHRIYQYFLALEEFLKESVRTGQL